MAPIKLDLGEQSLTSKNIDDFCWALMKASNEDLARSLGVETVNSTEKKFNEVKRIQKQMNLQKE